MKIPIQDQSSTYECRWVKINKHLKRLWIVELDSHSKGSIWYPTFSKYCNHFVMGGECINCSLVIEGDE